MRQDHLGKLYFNHEWTAWKNALINPSINQSSKQAYKFIHFHAFLSPLL